MEEFTTNLDDIFSLEEGGESELALVWSEPPGLDISTEGAIRGRVEEFFRQNGVSVELRALGLLSQQLLVETAGDMKRSDARTAASQGEKGRYLGGQVIMGMKLRPAEMPDHEPDLVVAFSPVGNYGNEVGTLAVPISRLDKLTGGVAGELAKRKPELVEVLLSAESDEEQRNQARVDLMRFLAGKKPEAVTKSRGRMEFKEELGLVYSPDGEAPVLEIYPSQIPETDLFLREAVNLRQKLDAYSKAQLRIRPEDRVSPRIIKRANRLSQAIRGLSERVGEEMLDLIQQDEGDDRLDLPAEKVETMFRESHEVLHRAGLMKRKLSNNFSILKVVQNQTPFKKLNI
ncbi:hypothetical protein MUP65_00235 [Patescibacteria group bacterium]|nr:hypothetical protein [Patescibacteria group bacterium]